MRNLCWPKFKNNWSGIDVFGSGIKRRKSTQSGVWTDLNNSVGVWTDLNNSVGVWTDLQNGHFECQICVFSEKNNPPFTEKYVGYWGNHLQAPAAKASSSVISIAWGSVGRGVLLLEPLGVPLLEPFGVPAFELLRELAFGVPDLEPLSDIVDLEHQSTCQRKNEMNVYHRFHSVINDYN